METLDITGDYRHAEGNSDAHMRPACWAAGNWSSWKAARGNEGIARVWAA